MENGEDKSGTAPCPYCGAGNSLDSEFCGLCYKNLRIPAEVRAGAKARDILEAAAPDARKAEARPTVRLWARVLAIIVLFLFYLQWFKKEDYFSPLDFVNLAFHEAGHVFLGFFPRFIMVLGGTIFQLLLPSACLVHFMRRGARLGWQLCLFWLGENLLNISIYAGDAINQNLPLTAGGVHDWTYLLTETGLIAHTYGVGRAIFTAGSAVIFCSFYFIAKDAWSRTPLGLGYSGPDSGAPGTI